MWENRSREINIVRNPYWSHSNTEIIDSATLMPKIQLRFYVKHAQMSPKDILDRHKSMCSKHLLFFDNHIVINSLFYLEP